MKLFLCMTKQDVPNLTVSSCVAVRTQLGISCKTEPGVVMSVDTLERERSHETYARLWEH